MDNVSDAELPLFQELRKVREVKKNLFPKGGPTLGNSKGFPHHFILNLRKARVTKFNTSVRRLFKVLVNLLFEKLRKLFPYTNELRSENFSFLKILLMIFLSLFLSLSLSLFFLVLKKNLLTDINKKEISNSVQKKTLKYCAHKFAAQVLDTDCEERIFPALTTNAPIIANEDARKQFLHYVSEEIMPFVPQPPRNSNGNKQFSKWSDKRISSKSMVSRCMCFFVFLNDKLKDFTRENKEIVLRKSKPLKSIVPRGKWNARRGLYHSI